MVRMGVGTDEFMCLTCSCGRTEVAQLARMGICLLACLFISTELQEQSTVLESIANIDYSTFSKKERSHTFGIFLPISFTPMTMAIISGSKDQQLWVLAGVGAFSHSHQGPYTITVYA